MIEEGCANACGDVCTDIQGIVVSPALPIMHATFKADMDRAVGAAGTRNAWHSMISSIWKQIVLKCIGRNGVSRSLSFCVVSNQGLQE